MEKTPRPPPSLAERKPARQCYPRVLWSVRSPHQNPSPPRTLASKFRSYVTDPGRNSDVARLNFSHAPDGHRACARLECASGGVSTAASLPCSADLTEGPPSPCRQSGFQTPENERRNGIDHLTPVKDRGVGDMLLTTVPVDGGVEEVSPPNCACWCWIGGVRPLRQNNCRAVAKSQAVLPTDKGQGRHQAGSSGTCPDYVQPLPRATPRTWSHARAVTTGVSW